MVFHKFIQFLVVYKIRCLWNKTYILTSYSQLSTNQLVYYITTVMFNSYSF